MSAACAYGGDDGAQLPFHLRVRMQQDHQLGATLGILSMLDTPLIQAARNAEVELSALCDENKQLHAQLVSLGVKPGSIVGTSAAIASPDTPPPTLSSIATITSSEGGSIAFSSGGGGGRPGCTAA